MLREISLSGKTALVTGGGTGLGLGFARELADMGARVILAGRRQNVLEQASLQVPGSIWRTLDLTKLEQIDPFVEALWADAGPVDILVNNAGIQNNKPALDFTDDELLAMFQTHVFGSYRLTCSIASRLMQAGRTGSVIFISSSAAHMGLTNASAYTGAKGAVSALCRSLSSEFAPHGIRVNAVCPGWIETDLVRESLCRVPQRRAMVERRCLVPGLGCEKDVGMAVAFLASDAARYITAIDLKVDGGIAVSL